MGVVTIKGMTILEVEAYVDVFREAFAIAAGVLIDQVAAWFTESDDDGGAARRRLEDAVNVHYAITSETSASLSKLLAATKDHPAYPRKILDRQGRPT